MVGIYLIDINDKFYVGSSCEIEKRQYTHNHKLLTGKHHSIKLQRAYDKYQQYDFVIIELCLREDLKTKEQYWLDVLNVVDEGYNICRFADRTSGVVVSEETRAKLSKAHKGRKPSYVLTPEIREKLAAAARGNTHWQGKKHSEESKQKVSQTKRGVSQGPCSDSTKEKIRQRALERYRIIREEKAQGLDLLSHHRAHGWSEERRKAFGESNKKRAAEKRKIQSEEFEES